MNLILLPKKVDRIQWDRSNSRFRHLTEVLRVEKGTKVDFAVENGPRGKGKIEFLDSQKVEISFKWNQKHAVDFLPIRLLVGLSRPQTCRKILEQAAALGVSEFHFFEAEKGEPSYASSTLWTSGEWREKIRNGVEQGFASHVPTCKIHSNLAAAVCEIREQSYARIALDNYESTSKLTSSAFGDHVKAWLAVGSERGWSGAERDKLRKNKFELFDLGNRVLRVETAVVAAIGILGSRMIN